MYFFFNPDMKQSSTEDYGYQYYFSGTFKKYKENAFDMRDYMGQDINYNDYTYDDLDAAFEYFARLFNRCHNTDYPIEQLISAIILDTVHTLASGELYTNDGDYVDTVFFLNFSDLKEQLWDSYKLAPLYSETEPNGECLIYYFLTPDFRRYRVEISS